MLNIAIKYYCQECISLKLYLFTFTCPYNIMSPAQDQEGNILFYSGFIGISLDKTANNDKHYI